MCACACFKRSTARGGLAPAPIAPRGKHARRNIAGNFLIGTKKEHVDERVVVCFNVRVPGNPASAGRPGADGTKQEGSTEKGRVRSDNPHYDGGDQVKEIPHKTEESEERADAEDQHHHMELNVVSCEQRHHALELLVVFVHTLQHAEHVVHTKSLNSYIVGSSTVGIRARMQYLLPIKRDQTIVSLLIPTSRSFENCCRLNASPTVILAVIFVSGHQGQYLNLCFLSQLVHTMQCPQGTNTTSGLLSKQITHSDS